MPFAKIWCLGDLVGYGPNPNECVDVVRSFDHVVVAGNHDWVASGKQSAAGFNPHAAIAARWTATKLSTESRQFLLDLPEAAMEGDFLLVHGSPRAPTAEYLFRTEEAQRNFPHFTSTYCLVGHTHVPCAFIAAGQTSSPDVTRVEFKLDEPLPLDGRTRMIINPGSVGQPRDYNPHAAFMVYDSAKRELHMHRVSYNVAATQQKMRIANLPVPLIERLEFGI